MESLEPRQLLTTVTVALGQNAQEGVQTGYFVFSRDETAGSLTVPYSIDQSASTAAYGMDYSSPPTTGSVYFAPGQPTVILSVVPTDDPYPESTESVVVRIEPGEGYTIGLADSATLSILDNDSGGSTTVSVAATQNAAEPG